MVVFENFTQNQFVGVLPEGVSEHGLWDQVHVTVGPLRLIGAGAIKVPFRKIYSDTEQKNKNNNCAILMVVQLTTLCYLKREADMIT